MTAALARLDQEAARLAQQSDPTADVVISYAAAVRALSRLVSDAKRQVDAHSEAVAEMVRTAVIPRPLPLARVELRAAVGTALKDYLPAFGRAIHFAALVALLAIIIAAFGAGYWWRSTRTNAVMVTNCAPAPQASGGEAFACTFWTHPPTPGQR